MVNSFNNVFQEGEMSPLQRHAVMGLLDKAYARRQLSLKKMEAYITVKCRLQNSFETIVHRKTNYLPKLINNNQAGYGQNRNMSENIRTRTDIMEYLRMENRPGIIINVDFEKAFDSVE